MARPKRNIEAEWIDIFADWDIAEQERTLAFLTELHRQAKRQASRNWSDLDRPDLQARAAAEMIKRRNESDSLDGVVK